MLGCAVPFDPTLLPRVHIGMFEWKIFFLFAKVKFFPRTQTAWVARELEFAQVLRTACNAYDEWALHERKVRVDWFAAFCLRSYHAHVVILGPVQP